MPLTIHEVFKSRNLTIGDTGKASHGELNYALIGSEDSAAVLALLQSTAPATVGNMLRATCAIEPIGPEVWLGTATYEDPNFGDAAGYTLEIGGGTEHIQNSISTTARYPTGGGAGGAPDRKGAINDDGQEVHGVDIFAGKYEWSENHFFTDAQITAAYKVTLAGLANKTNNAVFRSFAIDEVLFVGVSGQRRAHGDWELNFKFAASPNKTGIVVGALTAIAKKGWEYLWVFYEKVEDAVTHRVLQVPKYAYVEKVYDTADFTDLGI